MASALRGIILAVHVLKENHWEILSQNQIISTVNHPQHQQFTVTLDWEQCYLNLGTSVLTKKGRVGLILDFTLALF